jgi:hypothetical protein
VIRYLQTRHESGDESLPFELGGQEVLYIEARRGEVAVYLADGSALLFESARDFITVCRRDGWRIVGLVKGAES